MSIPFAGTTPASAFTPNDFADPQGPPIILADAIDPATNEFTELLRSFDPVDAAVQLTLSVGRGSAPALEGVGNRFAEIRYVSDDLPTVAESIAREAVSHLVRAGLVEVKGVDTQQLGADGGASVLRYRNVPEQDDRVQEVLT